MLKAPISLNVEVLYEDLLESIEYGNQERVTKLLQIPEVVARSLIPNSTGHLEVLGSAAKGGNLEIFEELTQNPAIFERVAHYSSAFDTGLLGTAVENNHLSLVKKLLTIPNVLEKGSNLSCVLGYAANLGHVAIVEECLKNPTVASYAYSALHFALDEGTEDDQIAGIKLLLAVPGVIEQIVANHCTQIVHGFLYPEIAEVLLAIPAISEAIHREPSAALRYACTSEMAAVLSIPSVQNRLAQCQEHDGFDQEFYNRMISEFSTDLEVANIDLIRNLLKIEPIYNYFSLKIKQEELKIAAFAGRLDLLQDFIEERQGDPEVDEELFSWACEGGNLHVVLYLLGFSDVREAVLSDTQDQYNLLNDAAVSGNVKILNVLLSLISYDVRGLLGDALVSASELGHSEIVKRLLELPHVYNDTSIKKIDAIVQAAKQGHTEVLTLLLATPHDLSGIQARDIREILSSPSSTLAIIETLLHFPCVASHPCLANETLMAAERGDLSLMKRLLNLPVVMTRLTSQPDLAITALKATLKAIMKIEGSLQIFKSEFNNAKIDIVVALDKILGCHQISAKQHLTKMQRTILDTYRPAKQALLDYPTEHAAEDSEISVDKSLIFSTRKREVLQTPNTVEQPVKRARPD